MKLIERNPQDLMFSNAIHNLFNDSFLARANEDFGRKFSQVPSANIKEDDTSYGLELAVPGFAKDDFSIELDENVLTISGKSVEEKNEAKEKYSRREFSYNSFKRSFTLPKNKIDEAAIKASYEAGVLHIELPKKKEEVQRKKAIEIS